MDILVQSVLQKAKLLGASVNIRFCERKGGPLRMAENESALAVTSESRGSTNVTSHVIIHRQFGYLEPVVRQIFDGAEDVQVILDRRWHERRQSVGDDSPEDRRRLQDRRASNPMLDVLIRVDA